jgi:O-antigen/teichoic acid export membrane protein
VTALIQLVAVPLLLRAWGAAKYGDWLILSAMPTYLALSNLGFGNASGSDMTMRVAAGDRTGALQTFQSSWVLLTTTSAVLILLLSVTVWHVPWCAWLHLSSLSNPQAAEVILILGVYAAVGQQNSVFESGYRCDGHFATGTTGLTLLRLVEALAAVAVALRGGSLRSVSLTYLTVRCLGIFSYWVALRVKCPWIRLGTQYAQWAAVRRLARPAFGFLTYPASQALSVQGFSVAVGVLLGPVAVVEFTTIRTLTRINIQLLNIISCAIWPVLSTAFGGNDIDLARRLHHRAFQVTLLTAVLDAALLMLVGPTVYRIWTHNAVTFDNICFYVLVATATVNALWFTSFAVLMSNNTHHRAAFSYFIGTIASIVIAVLLIPVVGLVGAAIALLALEFWMSVRVLPAVLVQLDVTPAAFALGLLGYAMKAQPGEAAYPSKAAE